jgi:hypothetical protein
MWLFTIHAIPDDKSPDFKEVGGAYVNCWINFALEDGAELLAKFYIQQNDWIVLEVSEISWVEEEDYPIDDPKRKYFQEAQADGTSFVYHQYPLEDEEDWGNNETNISTRTNH